MSPKDKVVTWLKGEIKSPPFSSAARLEAGFLLRQLQSGALLSLPQSRPMPIIGRRCNELRINDQNKTWRIIYRIDEDAILVLEVFAKKTNTTSKKVIDICKERIGDYENAIK